MCGGALAGWNIGVLHYHITYLVLIQNKLEATSITVAFKQLVSFV